MYTVFDRVRAKVEGIEQDGTIIDVSTDNKGAEYEVLMDEGGTNYYRHGDGIRRVDGPARLDVVTYEGGTWTIDEIIYNSEKHEVRAKLSAFPVANLRRWVDFKDLKRVATGGPVNPGTVVVNVVKPVMESILSKSAERVVNDIIAMCPGPKYAVGDRVEMRSTRSKGTVTAYYKAKKLYTILLDNGGKIKRRADHIHGKAKDQFKVEDRVTCSEGIGVINHCKQVRIGSKTYLLYAVKLEDGSGVHLCSPKELKPKPGKTNELCIMLNGHEFRAINMQTLLEICDAFEDCWGCGLPGSKLGAKKASVGRNRQLMSFINRNKR